MKLKNLTLICLCLAVNLLNAQKSPEKFGRISDEEMDATVCPTDENAHAYFIFDFGKTWFHYASTTVRESDPSSGRKGFQMYFERHYRIKILDNQAFDWADIEIPLFHNDEGSREELTQFRAATYNREGRKIDDVKLRRGDLITEEKNENWDILKCALSNVKPGSVIEVEYTIKSDFLYNLQSWQFQYTIPVLHSEYFVTIPEYFKYNQKQWGYYPINVEHDSKSNSISITYYYLDQSRSSQTIDFEDYIYHYTAENIPAFPVEKYLTTPDNYLSKVDFELSYTKYPGQTEEHYTQSWESINRNLLNHNRFGSQLNRERFLKDEVAKIQSLYGSDTLALIGAAMGTVKNRFTWNGMYRKYTTGSLRDAYKSGSGSSADINLTLVVLLRELGLEAYPVLLSTRDNGIIHPAHPSLSSFNYVAAVAFVDDDYYLMDATEPLSEVNMLPTRCLNNKGWVVDERRNGWIDLQVGRYAKSANYEVTLDESGTFSGIIDYTYNGYGAFDERLKAAKFNNYSEFFDSKFKDISGIEIKESSVEGIDSLYNDINIHLELELTEHLENAGDLYFFEPLLLDRMKENPFRIEDRQYPVEFEYPITEMQTLTITIPENYTVEELPKPMIVNLDDQSAKFTYNISQLGNKIQITSLYSIDKVLFIPEQYPYLKQLIDMIVDKHQEQIVLKKI